MTHNRKCKNCEYYVPNEKGTSGECNRFPPIPVSLVYTEYTYEGNSRVTSHVEYYCSIVDPDYGCGEFKPNEDEGWRLRIEQSERMKT